MLPLAWAAAGRVGALSLFMGADSDRLPRRSLPRGSRRVRPVPTLVRARLRARAVGSTEADRSVWPRPDRPLDLYLPARSKLVAHAWAPCPPQRSEPAFPRICAAGTLRANLIKWLTVHAAPRCLVARLAQPARELRNCTRAAGSFPIPRLPAIWPRASPPRGPPAVLLFACSSPCLMIRTRTGPARRISRAPQSSRRDGDSRCVLSVPIFLPRTLCRRPYRFSLVARGSPRSTASVGRHAAGDLRPARGP